MMNSVKDFRGKIEPPVEKAVLKIERYAQRLTQGYSAYGGSYLWAPVAKTSSGEKWKIEILQRKKVIGRPENDLNCCPTRRNRLVTSRR